MRSRSKQHSTPLPILAHSYSDTWNGSIRIDSKATVERAIGEMGHKIRSRKTPFSKLSNLIIKKETSKVLSLRYPELVLVQVDPVAERRKLKQLYMYFCW